MIVVFIVFDNAKAHQRQENSEYTRSRAGFLRSSESKLRQPELTSVSGTADKHTLGRPEALTHATEWALAATTTTTNTFFWQTWVSRCFLQPNKECEGRHQAKLYQRYYSCSAVSGSTSGSSADLHLPRANNVVPGERFLRNGLGREVRVGCTCVGRERF